MRVQKAAVVQTIHEILQTLARQRGRGDALPLLTYTPLEGAGGERIAHLPIDSELAQAWVALTGEPFRPHQAHALTALRRGEPVALRAASADAMLTANLLLYATLLADPATTALIVPPDEVSVQATWARIAQLNQALPRTMQINALPIAPNRRPDVSARVVIASPVALHTRLLRHHDRGWSNFWARLQLVLLPDLQQFTGVAAAQLADLLFRSQRIAAHHGGHAPNFLAVLHDVAEADTVLTGLLGQPWRVVAADDGPRAPSGLAVWRGGSGWRRDVTELATTFQRQGYQVHIVCRQLDRPLLAQSIGDVPRVTFGPELMPAQVLIAAGFPAGHSAVRRMLHSGSQAVVVVLGELPHEQALARQPQDFAIAPASSWVAPGANAYVLARHVVCAASELPLTEIEAGAWGVLDIVERLVAQEQLVDLPDPEVAWKPTDAAGDPYADWSLRSASGGAAVARNEQSQSLGMIEADLYDRWAFPNAALPPGVGGYRVLARDDDTGAMTLRAEPGGRRTYPLRRCTVTVRDARESRTMVGNRAVAWGRVVVEEECYGYREASSNSAPADIALNPKLNTRWAAPACWFELHTDIQVQGQFIGWSLAAALQLRALADFTDVVPCYDYASRRLYLVDAQPGGNGLSAWAYTHAEELLPLAYDIALACRSDPLLEPLCRADMDWLLLLLGRQVAEVSAAPSRPPARVEFIPAPEPPATAPPPSVVIPRKPARSDEAPRPARAPSESPAVRPSPPPEARPVPVREEPVPPTPEPELRPLPLWDEPKPAVPEPEPPIQRPARAPGEPPAVRQPPAPEAPTSRPRDAAPPPPNRPTERTPAPAEEEAAPDAQALIERLRRQRQQREARQQVPPRTPVRPSAEAFTVAQRFAAGDKVFCLPYGDGEVRESHVEDGRELLTVTFPDLGDLPIDPMLNLVRKLGTPTTDDDDLL